MERVPLLFRSAMYALRGGFLIRPFVIAVLLGTAGAVMSSVEEAVPAIGFWIPETLFPSRQDPQVAQAILTSIATSIMTVVSIVFAILLMTLTLASTQFSPRILVGFVRDRTTQWTLGVFLGTFSFCIAALPAARSLPQPFVPVVTTSGAMVLALVCVGWLIYFIHHISLAVSVNHIVDRIARETELVIDEFMPRLRAAFPLPQTSEIDNGVADIPVLSRRSGYIRYLDVGRLLHLAKDYRIRVRVERRVGQFVPAGVPLLWVSRAERITAERSSHLLATFDIGPTRTMQQDVEFGVIQLVDIALRAISPAVNDPSTAISCIDQLSRVLIRWISRAPPLSYFFGPPHVLRVVVPWISVEGLFDTAFEQIRHYSAADIAVSLRLLRAFNDIASAAPNEEVRLSLIERARRVVDGCAARLHEYALHELRQRLAFLEMPVTADT
ncbi:MAG TPA: DUF2254 domain-containing protein [Stellaceae bacterium]|nr:DUF2254 domain-containing protein [Stellaceae bacterium]